MVIVLPDILTPDELGAIHAQLVQLPWASGVSAGAQARLVKRNLQVPETPETRTTLDTLRAIVMRALNRSPDLIAALLPNKVVPPNFNRYTPEHPGYGAHIDNTLRPLPDGSWLRTDVSATLFLNAPSDYDGGELTIHDAFGTHRVKLDAGALVAYPSGSLHEVTPVTHGERLACYLFIQSLVASAEHRRQLWDLDQSLRRLRAELGDGHPDLVRLTGVYHNLLRQWSQT